MNEESLMRSRIRRILMICSNYDAFTLEEDGKIESQIVSEYRELNLSNPPTFVWANSSLEAGTILESDSEIDMIICMYNDRDKDVFSFAAKLRLDGSKIPFIMLIHYSKSVRQRIFENDRTGI
ncbi:MAG: response regulator, partial [Bacteroidales bacterium]|nr:response regulator [Bacteroidales bacterium]